MDSYKFFPPINATLNAIAFILLFLGYQAIKRGDQNTHRKYMVSALLASTLFLVCYITYHALRHGIVTKYSKEGISKVIYFFILGTHTPLAMIIVPFVIAAIYFAIKGDFARHTKITRWLLPVWMYVSITGVLIYLMLYVF